jgi:hypothetical protein
MRSRTDETLRYVQFLARRFDKQDVNAVTLIILYDLNIQPNNEGFGYLRKAIEMDLSSSSRTITKGIYPVISFIYDSHDAWKPVDQAIRRAIKAAWNERDEEVWNLFFPPRSGRKPKCPSNKEFIARISCIIELWQSCKEADYERIE